MADPLDAFPDVDDDAVRDLVVRHQRLVRDFPDVSVADLVYEYRTRFHRDPFVARDGPVYYLAVRSHVWDDFADRMELSEAELARLKAAHAEQFEADVGETGEGESGDYEPLVLVESN